MEAIVLGDFGESITPLLAFSLNVQVKHILLVSSGLFEVEKVYSTWQKPPYIRNFWHTFSPEFK